MGCASTKDVDTLVARMQERRDGKAAAAAAAATRDGTRPASFANPLVRMWIDDDDSRGCADLSLGNADDVVRTDGEFPAAIEPPTIEAPPDARVIEDLVRNASTHELQQWLAHPGDSSSAAARSGDVDQWLSSIGHESPQSSAGVTNRGVEHVQLRGTAPTASIDPNSHPLISRSVSGASALVVLPQPRVAGLDLVPHPVGIAP